MPAKAGKLCSGIPGKVSSRNAGKLSSEYAANLSDQRKKALNQQIEMAGTDVNNVYINFGKTHFNSYLGIDIIYRNRQTIGNPIVATLYKKMSDNLKNTVQGKGLKTFVFEVLAEVGKPMPDFSARTFSGKDFKLSTLKGKYIYLTFGAAGCAPCRFENKLIRNHYDSLSNKIAFVNFSTDRTKKAWETTTQYDKIVWDNVSDLGMKYGQVKDLYNVQAMPTSFLIDKNGIIIKKFIGYSPDLIEVITKAVQ